jgi:hypothetical protein
VQQHDDEGFSMSVRGFLKTAWNNVHHDGAQVLPIMALLLVVFIGLMGLAIDVGRIFIARTELSRAVDAAALAGIVELPNVSNAQAKAATFLTQNQPDATISFPVTTDPYQIKIKGTRSYPMFFMRIFGFGSVTIGASATAGSGASQPVDIILVTDDTGTMKGGCDSGQTNSTCPIKEERDAATAFVNQLLGPSPSGAVRIGMVKFRGCYGAQRYNPVSGEAATRGCILPSEEINLTTNTNVLLTAIGNMHADGGYPGTNICLGIEQGYAYLTGANSRPNAKKIIVVAGTDGDNRYSDGAESNSSGNNPSPNGPNAPPVYPPTQWPNNNGTPTDPCRPTGPALNGTSYGALYDARINNLDTRTMNVVNADKAATVEFFVGSYGTVGGPPTNALCNTALVGTGSGRDNNSDTWDRNLLKCIASSSTGTNDHYFEATAPGDIITTMSQIQRSIAFRLVE